jgi:hypothetical protein
MTPLLRVGTGKAPEVRGDHSWAARNNLKVFQQQGRDSRHRPADPGRAADCRILLRLKEHADDVSPPVRLLPGWSRHLAVEEPESSAAISRWAGEEVPSTDAGASTFVPDLTPPTTTIAGLSGSNPTTIDTATGTIALSLNGHDTGGSGLAYFQVYASVDGSAYQPVAWAIPAGVPDSSGNVQATYLYQGATDGQAHTYAFYSIGIDGAGNVEPTPAAAELSLNPTFAAAVPSQLGVAGLTVEHGAAERSYIRYLDLGFNESNAQSGGELANIVNSVVNNPNSPSAQDITLYRYSLSGTGTPTRVSLPTTLKVIDHAIEIDFGAGGIGGAPNSNAADGYYELDIKLPNGTASVHHFYRLLGDVTGDGMVDGSDINAISAALNEKAATGMGALNVDVNGDGTVSALDLVLATRSKGRKLASGLSLG